MESEKETRTTTYDSRVAQSDKIQDLLERVADLEIKMAKLWMLLLDKTPAGQDKLSRPGKTFKEKLKEAMK